MKTDPRGLKHGLSDTPEYRAWCEMRKRCNTKTTSNYKYYGGRGIRVCERWDDFANFIADMGKKPEPSFSLDRIDANGDYTPKNCRWASWKDQCRNKRGTMMIEHNGAVIPLIEFFELEPRAVSYNRFRLRVRAGISIGKALLPEPLPRGQQGVRNRSVAA